VWDAQTFKPLAKIEGGVVGDVSFSQDGQRVVTTSWDNAPRLWNANTGEFLRVTNEEDVPLSAASGNHNFFTKVLDSEVLVVQPLTLPDLSRILKGESVDSVLGSGQRAHGR
jgi:WD40 repeat protein